MQLDRNRNKKKKYTMIKIKITLENSTSMVLISNTQILKIQKLMETNKEFKKLKKIRILFLIV